MDLDRMLRLCRRHQWSVDDLDWTGSPRVLNREDEVAVVQYFIDMSGIELLAAELFAVQRDRATDPVLREIFASFVIDERRHSEVARRLSSYYNVHEYQRYELNPHLIRFRDPFVRCVRTVGPELANAYIITGELLLDVALLRSLDDFVDDDMSHQAMRLINRDESRHIAMDYYMADFYAHRAAPLFRSPTHAMQSTKDMLAVLYHAGPFFKDVFFAPMDIVDPTGRRLLEAFKRIQIMGEQEHIAKRPFPRFMGGLQDTFNHPTLGKAFGPMIKRTMGLDPRVIKKLYTKEEAMVAKRSTMEELAQEALAVKSG